MNDTAAPTTAKGRQRTPKRIEFLTRLLGDALGHNGYGFSTVVESDPAEDSYTWAVIYDHRENLESAPCSRCSVIVKPAGWYWEAADGTRCCGEDQEDHEPTRQTWRVDLDTMAKGLGIIRNAVMREVEHDGMVPHNKDTGQRLYFGGSPRKDLLEADRTNGEEGDYDVIGALAVLECALFGAVVYA